MRLIVDTSIVFSLFKPDSFTRQLMSEHNFELFAPKEIIEELSKYSDLICSKSKISKDRFLSDVGKLSDLIEFKTPSHSFILKADKLISHKSDIPFLALAMEMNIPIWSNDEHFKKQDEVKVFTTEEIDTFLD
jgi:predicted nucleic acid-binding protein